MIDVAAIKRGADLQALVSESVTLRKTANTRGGEYHGPCLFCGGKDRFWMQPHADPPIWKCRACGKGGDAIKFLMERDGLSFLDACRELERRFGLQPTPVQPRSVRLTTEEPTPAWRNKATSIAAECMTTLYCGGPLSNNALDYLRSRGLKDDTITTFCLGYSTPLTKRVNSEGEEELGQSKYGLWVPAGITIPVFAVDNALWGVNIRRPKGEPKYKGVAGSKLGALMGRLTGKDTLVLTEGPFDCALLWQEAGDLVDVATFGSAAVGLTPRWLPYLLRYRRVLLAYDNDDAGDEGAGRLKTLVRARRVRVPLAAGKGKDISDLWIAGGNLRNWVSLLLAATVK